MSAVEEATAGAVSPAAATQETIDWDAELVTPWIVTIIVPDVAPVAMPPVVPVASVNVRVPAVVDVAAYDGDETVHAEVKAPDSLTTGAGGIVGTVQVTPLELAQEKVSTTWLPTWVMTVPWNDTEKVCAVRPGTTEDAPMDTMVLAALAVVARAMRAKRAKMIFIILEI